MNSAVAEARRTSYGDASRARCGNQHCESLVQRGEQVLTVWRSANHQRQSSLDQ